MAANTGMSYCLSFLEQQMQKSIFMRLQNSNMHVNLRLGKKLVLETTIV